MNDRLIVFIISCLILLAMLACIKLYLPKTNSALNKCIKWVTPYFIFVSIIYFFVIEWPEITREFQLRDEYRRIYFLELLSNQSTPNKLKEESFVKLVRDYGVTDFSGLLISNKGENYKTPFNFINCFQKLEDFVINGDSIVNREYDSLARKNRNIYNLANFNFTNADLQYSIFYLKEKLRFETGPNWGVVLNDDEPFDYNFNFNTLIDINLGFSNMQHVRIIRGNLYNVNLENSSLVNAQLQNTTLEYCNLRGVDFTGANIDSVYFVKCLVNDSTRFINVKNYDKIQSATPYLIERIKATQYSNKEISNWKFNYEKFIEPRDMDYKFKWETWEKLKFEYPNDYLEIYKNTIKQKLTEKYGTAYDWQRGL
ncbi:MAG: hypothetical protein A2068_15185 [Ignavibacteria bacterium GWB2_35_6b]|nr:MAG: hypothetical protein A2068_15185 [Ignavibacteria bacterium GWB2_35_6b]